MATKKELEKAATAIREILSGMLGHGLVEQCEMHGTDARGTTRLEIVVRPMAVPRLLKELAAHGLAILNPGPVPGEELASMVRENLEVLQAVDIDPASVSGESWLGIFTDELLAADEGFALGFISGCAAALNVTPLELLDSVPPPADMLAKAGR